MKTIAAISTAPAIGGIGVIRISGKDSLSIGDKVFSSLNGKKKLSDMKGYTATYGNIIKNGEKLDECIALVFRAPHSYTGEDVVELSCHGGIYILNKVLEFVYDSGAEPAQAGEFTKRAFLNGKIDLTQAEAVIDIISSQGEDAARAALNAKEGALQRKIGSILEKLLEISSHMSAWIDYPEDDIEELDEENLKINLLNVKESTQALINTFDSGQIVTQGIDTAIVGRTNVGKSSVMNFLCKEDKSIVTDIAGTTRDIVEVTARVGNAVLKLADTAGIRTSSDTVEALGIENAKKRLKSAGFVMAVIDGSVPLTEEDRKILSEIKNRPHIVIVNKSDLPPAWSTDELEENALVKFSAVTGNGEETLVDTVERVLETQNFNPYAPMIATKRQHLCCKSALESIDEALNAIEAGITLDAVNVCVDSAVSAFLELTGERATEKIVDNVFHRFCVGK